MPSIPNELFRMVLIGPASRGWLATRPGRSHSGSSRSRLIVGVADAVVEGGQIAGQFQRAGRAHRVADEALRVVEQRVAAVVAPHLPQGLALLGVAGGGARGVRADDVDVVGVHSRPAQRQADALGLAIGIGQDEVGGVAVHRVADDLAVDLRAAGPGVAEPFEHEHAAALGHHDAVAVEIEGPRGLRRVVVSWPSAPWLLKLAKMPKV